MGTRTALVRCRVRFKERLQRRSVHLATVVTVCCRRQRVQAASARKPSLERRTPASCESSTQEHPHVAAGITSMLRFASPHVPQTSYIARSRTKHLPRKDLKTKTGSGSRLLPLSLPHPQVPWPWQTAGRGHGVRCSLAPKRLDGRRAFKHFSRPVPHPSSAPHPSESFSRGMTFLALALDIGVPNLPRAGNTVNAGLL